VQVNAKYVFECIYCRQNLNGFQEIFKLCLPVSIILVWICIPESKVLAQLALLMPGDYWPITPEEDLQIQGFIQSVCREGPSSHTA